jgi:hypothetical protein
MATTEELSQSDFPDDRLKLFTDGGRFEIATWMRMEHLADDFLDFISEYAEVTEARRKIAYALPMLNAHDYDRELGSWFTPDQLKRLYERNPIWGALEQELYGSLVSLERR